MLRRVGPSVVFVLALAALHAIALRITFAVGADRLPQVLDPALFPRMLLGFPLDVPTRDCMRLAAAATLFEVPAPLLLGVAAWYGHRFAAYPAIWGTAIVLLTGGGVLAPLPQYAHAAGLPATI